MKGGIGVNIDTTFITRRREQQIRFERSVLRELSLSILKKSVQQFFGPFRTGVGVIFDQSIEEGCYDVALEVYLLGSRYSRIGYYGESFESVKSRTKIERDNFTNALAEFIAFWGNISDPVDMNDLKYRCEQFVNHWFKEGFTKGKLKYKMKLH